MAPRRRSTSRKTTPKVFRCTGFGNCNMTFTRSEHLARHVRKHTGEKPFKCVVPGCGRMFSRFDNMMQHTQTHDREGKKPASTIANDDDTTTHSSQRRHSYPSVPHPSQPTPPETSPYHPIPSPSSIMQNRTLPPPPVSQRRASIAFPAHPPSYPHRPPYDYSFPPHTINDPSHRSSMYPPTSRHPAPYPPYQQYGSYRRSWPTAAAGPIHAGYPLPSSAVNGDPRRYSTSTESSSASSPHSPQQDKMDVEPTRRRLSLTDLQTPIHILQNMKLGDEFRRGDFYEGKGESNDVESAKERISVYKRRKSSVDITSDEYEALQGFGIFHLRSIVKAHGAPPPGSPHLSSQVEAFRQRKLPVPESSLRPLRRGTAI
ncbi:uncharacterized protein BYT42DRAFT_549266 [Radiomyces spectabilis]|uniref:uncharacterized protein n=1 Tax=Radiomyces spectabilis TaxID=64574 RepID=UPI00221F9FFA|nr:uncharacterized protein BYT42DRAFT_549266 [Radiomyces spectabilis]KAI8369606.1 hypothetical protein BYT42DRAFT_549266 [Radiomyces spectabilis]